MVTLMELQKKMTAFSLTEETNQEFVYEEIIDIAQSLTPSMPLFPIKLENGSTLYMRKLDLPTAVRLTFGIPFEHSILALFKQFKGEGWTNPAVDFYKTTTRSADGKKYNIYSQFEFSLAITDLHANYCVGFHLVNSEPQGLYGRMIIVDQNYRRQNLAFLMFAFQAEYASQYGQPGELSHKKSIHLLKHKFHKETISTGRLLKKIGYSAFKKDPNDDNYWRVAARPTTILRKVKSLGYTEKNVYF